MKENGIEVLQSIPHAHQQNGHTERLIRMLREKAKTMRLEACLPQSWWEFTLDHATHVYNRTPVCHLNWQTPHQTLKGDKPYVNHLRVFGCGAYVFIPAEVRGNKLAPRSELMTYLGTHPGGKGWIFMRSPNNVIFSAAQATFDEAFFPKCPSSGGVRRNTQLHTPAPKPSPCPVREARIASVPIMRMMMMMITMNPHINHLILLQLPLKIIRGKRELGRTTIVLRRPNRSCLQGPLPPMLLKSLPRQLKLADPNDTLKSLNSQGTCMVINISHKLKKKSGKRGTGVK